VPSGVRYRPAHCFGLVVDRAGAGLLPSQVELLAYERVGVQVDGRGIWRIDGQEVDPSSIWHVWAFTVPGQVLGLSPIDHARQAVGLGLGAERYAARFFGQSAIPSGVLTSDQDIKQERADQLKARWREAHAAQRDTPSSAPAPSSKPSRSHPSRRNSWKRPAPTSPPSPGTSACSRS
jgi:hypothetical protein